MKLKTKLTNIVVFSATLMNVFENNQYWISKDSISLTPYL